MKCYKCYNDLRHVHLLLQDLGSVYYLVEGQLFMPITADGAFRWGLVDRAHGKSPYERPPLVAFATLNGNFWKFFKKCVYLCLFEESPQTDQSVALQVVVCM